MTQNRWIPSCHLIYINEDNNSIKIQYRWGFNFASHGIISLSGSLWIVFTEKWKYKDIYKLLNIASWNQD